jgi:threonine synthase
VVEPSAVAATWVFTDHVLRCVLCQRTYPPTYGAATCPEHGSPGGVLDVEQVGTASSRGTGTALVANANGTAHGLPGRASGGVGLAPGYLARTPLVDAPRLAEDLGIAQLLVKDEGRNPTGSLKDRPSALAVELALALGYRTVACASTGNAASSLAGACANVGLVARIFVPAGTPAAKLAQLAAFGARVVLVDGSYDQAWRLCESAVREFGWYNRNCAVNPYLIEAKKTCAHEVAEDLAGEAVDWVSVSVGDGCTVSALYKGFQEAQRSGVLAAVPRLLAVQAAGAAPIVNAFNAGVGEVDAVVPHTTADSISVGSPRNAVKALRALAGTRGAAVAVDDDEIMAAQRCLARLGGVYAEPGGAAGIAGVRRARHAGLVGRGARVVHVATGSGLKSSAILGSAEPYPLIEPVLSALNAVMAEEARHL